MNITLAKQVLETLASVGVKDVLLCAGARNSPLVVLLEKATGVKVWNFFEERSAGFFALGRSQRDQTPVAIITTSGTAVAELLPAAVEATYTQTPLIFVTADRPRAYRGTGAPQSIDQVGIFFKYVETCVDIAHPDEGLDISLWSRKAPLQINVCFDEPLIDEEIPVFDFSKIERRSFTPPVLGSRTPRVMNQPLVIAGPLTLEQSTLITPFLEKLGAPIYAESLSNLRAQKTLQRLFLNSGDKIVRELFVKGLCQSVIRVGGVPTLRFWRDLEEVFQKVPVTSLSEADYTGLSRPVQHVVGLKNSSIIKSEWIQDRREQIFALDAEKLKKLELLLQKYSRSEVALLAQLNRKMKSDFTYLGNSLPIRQWDLVHALAPVQGRQAGNRGANGIDGQISSFLGGAKAQSENWALIGDLTALYDLASLWITPQLEASRLRLVVINNKGGFIFKNIFENEIFLNRHQTEFSHWAKMWNWEYQKWDQISDTANLPERVMIELVPDAEHNHLFWQEYKSL
jgi:2-succinyl-5-enolpyruvyl-6-hydroxy-3-cyclohexene-1-carboxylate synthase